MTSDPVKSILNAVHSGPDSIPLIQERVQLFSHAIRELFPDCHDRPDIPNAIFDYDWADDELTQSEAFLRQILQSCRDSQTQPWDSIVNASTTKQARVLKNFTDGKRLEDIYDAFDFDSTRGTREELLKLQIAKKQNVSVTATPHVSSPATNKHGGVVTRVTKLLTRCTLPRKTNVGLYQDVGRRRKLEAYLDVPFSNWGATVSVQPKYTFVPSTVHAVQEIVKFAKQQNLSVRVSGYRHCWSPMFARTAEILISMLDIHTAVAEVNTETLAGVSTNLFAEASSCLNDIAQVGTLGEKTLVRVGCATTNEQLRRWSIGNKTVTLPINVIMVEITLGGSNAPICHGAGMRHQTLSDLVHAIEYVDANGTLQTITEDDNGFLPAASGCFGLIGIITHLVLKLDKMSYAVMKPMKIDVIDAIPPPKDMRDQIPLALRGDRTSAQIDDAQKRFEEQAACYYSEWFWFPYSDQVWINCWENEAIQDGDDGSTVEQYPPKKKIVQQWLEGAAIEALQHLAKDTGTEGFLPMLRTSLVSRMGMSSLPGDGDKIPIKAWLPDALHFRRAIQNTRVRDLEIEIPIPHLPKDPSKADVSMIQRAWWTAIISLYNHGDTCPQRMPLEMRIVGDSNVIMAPFRGNKFGTCSIEILTLPDLDDLWQSYAQEVLDKWMALRYRKEWADQKLNIRPHWAKEWYSFTVDGKPFLDYLKTECYRNEIVEFNQAIEAIGAKHGWTRKDIRARFSNDLMDQLFFHDLTDDPQDSFTPQLTGEIEVAEGSG